VSHKPGETMRPPSSGLTLDIPAEAANVAVVRHALTGLAQSIGMDDEGVADVQTVVTEACMNAVVHAYPEGGGRIEVFAEPGADSLLIEVRDDGLGIRPEMGVRDDGSSLRLGLTLIAALSSSYEISGGDGQGTRVAVRMPITRDEVAPAAVNGNVNGSDLRISATSPALLPEVMSRVVSAFGVRGDLSVDQISDSMLLGDAIAAAAPDAFGQASPALGLRVVGSGVEVSIGPLPEGGEERLREALRLPGGVGSIESLVDEVRSEPGEGGTYVIFRLGGSA
jgi:serine/threonine-protein kinase RsbW